MRYSTYIKVSSLLERCSQFGCPLYCNPEQSNGYAQCELLMLSAERLFSELDGAEVASVLVEVRELLLQHELPHIPNAFDAAIELLLGVEQVTLPLSNNPEHNAQQN